MKKIKPIYTIIICLSLLNCASKQNKIINDGSSFEKAIKVGSVEQEYKIVSEKCNDCKLKSQSLNFTKGKPFDILTFIKPNGEEIKYYFDISKFYGNF